MIGMPKFEYGDLVKFHIKDENKKSYEIVGKVENFHYSNEDILYDINDIKNRCIYEDIKEQELILVYGKKEIKR